MRVLVDFNCGALVPANVRALAIKAAQEATCVLPDGEDAAAKCAARVTLASQKFAALVGADAKAQGAVICKRTSIHFRCKRHGFGAAVENAERAAKHGIEICEDDFAPAWETVSFVAQAIGA